MNPDLITYKGKYKWKLRTSDLYENKEMEISWLDFLPKQGGTKYERSRLITSSQNFLLLRIERPYRKWRSGLSAGSVLNWYSRLRALVRWMIENGIWRFSGLGIDNVVSFLKSRKARHGGGVPTKTSINAYIDLFQDLWIFRHEYPAAIRIDVGEFKDEIWQESKARDATPWRAVDEGYALTLIRDSIEWIRTYGKFFIDAADWIYSEQKTWVGVSSHRQKKLSFELFSNICQQPLYKEISEKAGCGTNAPGLAHAFTVTIGAAINVLLFTVGQRVSELLRLDEGCVIVRVDEYEQTISYIRGIAAKKSGIPREWVAGDPIPEIVKWIEDVYETARKAAGLKALFVTRSQGSSIPLPRRRLRRMSTASPVTAMQAFANAPFRADRTANQNLHPHAARKTFAAFVVRRDKTALEALSLHFGHAYRAFTDGAYAGNLELQKLLNQADREELGRALTELLESPYLAGRAAASVESYRAHGVRFRGKLVLQRSVNELISRGIKVAPCNWGYCLYSQPTSSCRGDGIGPNELRRSPDVCAGCANFVVSNAHASWWNARVQSDEAFLANRAIPSQTREFVGKRVERSQQILRQLIRAGHTGTHETRTEK